MPSALATIAPLTGKKQAVEVTCPLDASNACVHQVLLSLQPSSGTKASAAKHARKPVVVAKLTVSLKSDTHRRVRFKLNAASRRLLRGHKLLRAEVKVNVSWGTAKRTFAES